MAQNPGSKQYFLGIEGEQSGPFSETDILAKIKKSLIPPDALVWHEGMPDWLPINTVEPFKTTLTMVSQQFSAPAPVAPEPAYKPSGYKPKAASQAASDDPFLMSDASGEPVFKAEVRKGFSLDKRKVVTILAVVGVIGVGGAAFSFFKSDILSLVGMQSEELPPSEPKKPVVKIDPRETNLRKAQSELLLSPDASLKTIVGIAKSSPTDKVAQEALQTALDYYKKMQRPLDAARLYLDCKRPLEAAKLFMAEQPPLAREAEEAYYAAYRDAPPTARREILIEDIKLLLGPLNNIQLATERIRELEKIAPNQPNPFQYYSKSSDEKISDIFARISFYFVQNLLAYINAELPQINLVNRPLIEIKKDRQGTYRIIGTYKGDVKLNQDKLSDIYFVFWLVNDQWVIVDTNLTEERKKFAKLEREKYKMQARTAESMLDYLQNVFHTQFPTTALHERVDTSKKKRSTATIE